METISSLELDELGAVFVEKLIVYLPLLLTFFGAWELAELGAASIVVQRASAAAGRAAVVVLPDDPAFYDDEPVGSFDGKRRTDIELAAAMILSAVPRLGDDFTVDVMEPSDPMGPIDVTVTATYDCGLASLVCGTDDEVELTSTTKHTYQGAKYAYGAPALGGSGAGLVAGRSGGRGRDEAEEQEEFRAGFRASVSRCEPGAAIDRYVNPNGFGRRGGDYGSSLSREALRYRCQKSYTGNSNVAVVFYQCAGSNQTCTIAARSGHNASHGERQAIRDFQTLTAGHNCSVVSVYTEREPCQDGQRCAGWLAGLGLRDSQVQYSFPYNPADMDPRTDAYYARGRQQCRDLEAQARQCRLPAPPLTSCDALRRYLDQNNMSGRACQEYLLAKEDVRQYRSRDQWNAQMAATVEAEMARECASLRHSRGPYGSGSDCIRPPARPIADIQADIVRKERQLQAAREEMRRPGPYTDVRRLRNRIATLESDLSKLRRELREAGG